VGKRISKAKKGMLSYVTTRPSFRNSGKETNCIRGCVVGRRGWEDLMQLFCSGIGLNRWLEGEASAEKGRGPSIKIWRKERFRKGPHDLVSRLEIATPKGQKNHVPTGRREANISLNPSNQVHFSRRKKG